MSDPTRNDGNRNDGNRNDGNRNDGNRNDENRNENSGINDREYAGEVSEPVEVSAADEHHAASETDPNGYTGTGSHSAAANEPAPEPTPDTAQDERLTHERYRPAVAAGPVGAAAAAPGTAPAPVPEPAAREEYAAAPTQPATQQPVYVQAPTPPRNRGNRGAGVLVALLGTVVYAALYALVAMIIVGVNVATAADATARFSEFIVRPVFYVPVIFFFLALSLLVALVNRGGWWAYVLFGFVVAAVVYLSYLGGALLTVQAWNFTPEEAARFIGTVWLNPLAIAAAVIAREVPIWAGAWIARRGRSVTARNAQDREEYDRQLAEGPQAARSA